MMKKTLPIIIAALFPFNVSAGFLDNLQPTYRASEKTPVKSVKVTTKTNSRFIDLMEKKPINRSGYLASEDYQLVVYEQPTPAQEKIAPNFAGSVKPDAKVDTKVNVKDDVKPSTTAISAVPEQPVAVNTASTVVQAQPKLTGLSIKKTASVPATKTTAAKTQAVKDDAVMLAPLMDIPSVATNDKTPKLPVKAEKAIEKTDSDRMLDNPKTPSFNKDVPALVINSGEPVAYVLKEYLERNGYKLNWVASKNISFLGKFVSYGNVESVVNQVTSSLSLSGYIIDGEQTVFVE